jgi:hypothetical protein
MALYECCDVIIQKINEHRERIRLINDPLINRFIQGEICHDSFMSGGNYDINILRAWCIIVASMEGIILGLDDDPNV